MVLFMDHTSINVSILYNSSLQYKYYHEQKL
jgi:hypothetical protein